MRTTWDIDDDVLTATKKPKEAQKTTTGRVISDLARRTLTRPTDQSLVQKNGFWVLPPRGGVVTTELVQRIAEDEL